jgi:RNA polymerase sigma-70 factor (ECF subfamily)
MTKPPELGLSDSPKTKSDPARWVEDHGDILYRFALLRVKDPHVAEDLVQETFISALQGLDRFKGGSAVRTWLVGILKHKIIDYYRKASREVFSNDLGALREGPGEEVVDRLIGAIAPPEREWRETPHKLLENKQFWDVFAGCLDGLTPAFRSAFTMRELDGLGTEEICKILDITPTNLWVILHRARAKLRGCLETKWFGDGKHGNQG